MKRGTCPTLITHSTTLSGLTHNCSAVWWDVMWSFIGRPTDQLTEAQPVGVKLCGRRTQTWVLHWRRYPPWSQRNWNTYVSVLLLKLNKLFKNCHYLFTPKLMESRVKFHILRNISGTSQQNNWKKHTIQDSRNPRSQIDSIKHHLHSFSSRNLHCSCEARRRKYAWARLRIEHVNIVFSNQFWIIGPSETWITPDELYEATLQLFFGHFLPF